jgi:ferric-dicitrate binding protein FerR (iron transport regulator)
MNESDDYLWDGSGPADPAVARLESLLGPLRHDAPLDELRVHRARPRSRRRLLGAGLLAAAAAAALLWWRVAPSDPAPAAVACDGRDGGFAFRARGGAVTCGGGVTPSGVLPVGGVLDTGAHEAELAIADIGNARLGVGTRVRLERSSAARHQLYLERGRMHAKVDAPPRIFAVTTPGASVVDLGCEYTLEVDAQGAGSITVQTGRVELVGEGTLAVVLPAGTHARLLPGRRAGLALLNDAPPALVAAAAAFDAREAGAIPRVLAAARAEDAFTIVTLARMTRDERRGVLDKLATLSPPPVGVTVDRALVDDAAFAQWHAEVMALLDARAFLRFE